MPEDNERIAELSEEREALELEKRRQGRIATVTAFVALLPIILIAGFTVLYCVIGV